MSGIFFSLCRGLFVSSNEVESSDFFWVESVELFSCDTLTTAAGEVVVSLSIDVLFFDDILQFSSAFGLDGLGVDVTG